MVELKKYLDRLPEGYVQATEEELLSENPEIILSPEDDCGLFFEVRPKVYEGHYLFASKGKAAVSSAKYILNEMFKKAEVIIGETPISNLAARKLSLSLGFKSYGRVWTPIEDCELFILTRKEYE